MIEFYPDQKNIIAFYSFKNSRSKSIDDSINSHHHVVELMKPVMSLFKSEVH